MHFLSNSTFLVLARDGNGHGNDDTSSSYKCISSQSPLHHDSDMLSRQADLIDITNATDIHGSSFDDPSNPIAKKGKLNKNITPATYVSFASFINDTQLARFSLHNGDPENAQLIDAKWESLALAPVGDPAFPNDYFLFTAVSTCTASLADIKWEGAGGQRLHHDRWHLTRATLRCRPQQ